MHRIAMNRAIDVRRARKKAAEKVFLLDDFVSVGQMDPEPPADPVDLRNLEDAVNDAISGLPDQQRTVLSMSMEKNMSQEEIAQVMECPVGTIKSRLHHARKVLRERLRRWLAPA